MDLDTRFATARQEVWSPRLSCYALPRLITVGASVIGCLLLFEAGLRVLHPVPVRAAQSFVAAGPRSGKEGTMTLVPGALGRVKRTEFDTTVRINSRGLRDREVPLGRTPDTGRILCLGDSQTFGWGVEAGQAWPQTLDVRMGDRVETINAGVPASGTAHQLRFLDEEGWRYSPDVVVVGFFFNDLRDNDACRMYDVADGKLTAYRTAPRGTTLETALGLPRSSEDITEVRAVEAPPQARASFLSRHFHLARWVRERLANMRGRADAELTGSLAPRSRVLTSKLLAEIARQCRTRGARCVVALLPSIKECGGARIPSLAAKYARVLEEVRAEGAEVVDLLPAFRERDYRPLYYPQDQHFTAAGHGAVADGLARLFRP